MSSVFLVNVENISSNEKYELRKNVLDWAFSVGVYPRNSPPKCFIVFWDKDPSEFDSFIGSLTTCEYRNVTGWAVDDENIELAYIAAFKP